FLSSRRRHTRSKRDWSSDVCSSDLSSASSVDVLKPMDKSLVIFSPPRVTTLVDDKCPFSKTETVEQPPPTSIKATPRFFSSWDNAIEPAASGCRQISETCKPALSTHFKILCKIVFEQVIMVPSISKRTPIIPRGSV